MREIVLINITGEDRPGLTAAITGVLAQGGVNILDIGQAVIHDTLSFGILVFPRFSIFSVFALMAIILIIRPWGLCGRPLSR